MSSAHQTARRAGTRPLLAGGVLAAVLTFLPAAGGAMEAAERPLTLDEAIERALRHNDDIIVQHETVAAADAGIQAARGAYDPLLNINGGWRRSSPPINSSFSGAPAGQLSPTTEGFEGGASVTQLLPWGGTVVGRTLTSRETSDSTFAFLTPAWGTQVGVELRQPLMRNRSTDAARLQITVSTAEGRLAGAALRQTVNEILTQVEETYWRLAAARRAVGVQEEAVRLAEEQMEQTRIRIEMGVTPETEISQPRAELERRRGDLIATREAAVRVQNALKLLILQDPAAPGAGEEAGSAETLWSDDLVPVDSTEVTVKEVDVEEALREGLARRPEVAAAQAALERRQAEAAFAHEEVKPALDAVVSYDRLGLAGDVNESVALFPGAGGPSSELEGGLGHSWGYVGSGDFEDTRAQLVFSVPVGNRTAKGVAAQAISAQRQAEAELVRARKIVRSDVLNAASALQTAGQRIEAARAAREAAEVQLSAERDRYENGLSTNFLVLTRQNDLSSARLDEISAVTGYLRARAELGRATGVALDERRLSVED